MVRYAKLWIAGVVVFTGTSIGCGQDTSGKVAPSTSNLVPVKQNTAKQAAAGDARSPSTADTPLTPAEASDGNDAGGGVLAGDQGTDLQMIPPHDALRQLSERPLAPDEESGGNGDLPRDDEVPARAADNSAADNEDTEQADLTALRTEIADLKARVAALEKSSAATSQSVEGIVENLSTLDGRLQRQIDNHADRLNAISQQDGERYVPSILGNMQTSDRFRREVSRAVQGQVVIENRTGVEQQIYINGTLWRAPTGKSETSVPFGPVITQLVPWEAESKRWTTEQWKASEEGQELHIVLGY